jgi:hypothetical protein
MTTLAQQKQQKRKHQDWAKTTVSERKPKFGLEHRLGCAVLSVYFCSGVLEFLVALLVDRNANRKQKKYQEPIRTRGGVEVFLSPRT